ncbi:NAD(P)H-dependent glycerol-3-phosphate dehydrogenase [Maridesulfovibrio hydrothermalis]|uniref:Glycerol-3-phosphate dehydrogenase [NAD(P)+] n=1 Tax=Maridesulfovibrio hydrothermalis AM13 = DSM 14728 TaxID=1121451 RepID=L0R8A1_9BACT|nr:NAD(P)H-dependent glycerol-3-phosphate dehydrogenase [Maridesulfovibrio hydrothermalis]CCO22442.1 Glycerol-3-phosphate dehydrogenase [NAD(P)+] [Maridesulfovibrio hydrothermalis AM13 = DSM 14728]
MKIAVIGAGAWGTTLANTLAKKGLDVNLWVREQELCDEMKETGYNSVFLPDYKLSENMKCDSDPQTVLGGADYYILVVPSQFMRASLIDLKPFFPKNPAVICASKGIELKTGAPMSEVVFEALEGLNPRYGHISGPTFAYELSAEMPTSITLGCEDKELAEEIQELFNTSYLRVYTNPDYRGVELGGAIKNIMAIAAGIADGLKFGHNARAALITRGIAEMSRLGVAMGATPSTFMGLSGMGDLVLTCTGDLSRNRQVGLKLGQGLKLNEILKMRMVAEGVKTTESVHFLAQKLGVEMPITEQVYKILYKDKNPEKAFLDLMNRDLKAE